QCRPLGLDKPALLELKRAEFATDRPDALALGLLACLDDPDPQIRDGIAYEAYVSLLRNDRVSSQTLGALRDRLITTLQSSIDTNGFHRPFAALVLAEVARADRLAPRFEERERQQLVQAAGRYLRSIDDYRGFDDLDGWRHGVAHAADLLMQLALHPQLGRDEHLYILESIASQVAPAEHSYIYGEPQRLMRPVYFIASRETLDAEDWARWFDSLAEPAPLASWDDAYSTNPGLSRLHNTRAFATALYPYVVPTSDEPRSEFAPLAQGVRTLLGVLP
ncbi:MAG: DUF2785 domain-containing protein, partial [Gammaproteobacteria bacterium]|nr:DUF2785 domain-containing protein [Gammaproteobacteria bacterium]